MSNIVETAYKPYIKAAPPDVKFNKEFKPVLVNEYEQLKDLLDPISDSVVGADTETNTLDFSAKGPIVGFSWSLTGNDGYYCPVRHLIGKNAPLRCLNVWHEFLLRNRSLWYQSNFDLGMMESEGYEVTITSKVV